MIFWVLALGLLVGYIARYFGTQISTFKLFVSISRGWGHEPGRTSTRSALAVDARVQSDMGDRDGWTKSGDREPEVYSFSRKPAR